MNNSGTYTWFGYLGSFEDRLKAIKEAGFDTICTFWTKEMEELDGSRIDQPEKADKAGLHLEHTHLNYFGCDALWNDDINAEKMVENYITDIRLAAKAGVSTLVMHPCEVYAPDMQKYPIMLGNMKKLADECAKLEIKLAIENLGENIAIRRVITDLCDNPFVGLCFDSGHNNLANGDYFNLLDEFKDRVFALHIHDNNGIKDQHILPYSENCTLNWKHFKEAIDKTSFEGSLMLEACYPMDYDRFTGEDDDELVNPPYPMEKWLNEAKQACDKIYQAF